MVETAFKHLFIPVTILASGLSEGACEQSTCLDSGNGRPTISIRCDYGCCNTGCCPDTKLEVLPANSGEYVICMGWKRTKRLNYHPNEPNRSVSTGIVVGITALLITGIVTIIIIVCCWRLKEDRNDNPRSSRNQVVVAALPFQISAQQSESDRATADTEPGQRRTRDQAPNRRSPNQDDNNETNVLFRPHPASLWISSSASGLDLQFECGPPSMEQVEGSQPTGHPPLAPRYSEVMRMGEEPPPPSYDKVMKEMAQQGDPPQANTNP